ncbi:hypothetical protein [uncultured Draconibacterium sp.]|uniref:hypothetical protein n=1 Tax=uncultured Draconibacterium sp. TaxID=1573823 RepID=UPI0029C91E50|nr:hypothetical protein [uncultured Draconibacterium sp.]
MSIHAWRQSDSYSFALTYFNENSKLLEPSVLFTGENGHGRTVSEFPILYFITAKIWKITGVTPAVLKFINFGLLLTGLFYLILLAKQILKDNFWSMFVVLFLFSSPVLGYYGFNFIPNIPAFGLALTGLYFLYMYIIREKNRDLILFTLLFILASLLKVTALISYLGAAFVAVTYYIASLKSKKWHFVKFVVSGILILFCYWSWYNFAGNYNQNNLQGVFNQSIIPVWELDRTAIHEILDKFYFNVFPVYFNQFAFYFLVLALVLLLVIPKVSNPFAKRAAGIYFLGLISFMLLFFQGLDVHDYFLTNTLVFIPAILIATLLALKNKFPSFIQSSITKVTATVFLLLLLNNGMIITRSHYNPHQKLVANNIPLKEREQGYWNYVYYRMEITDLQYQGIDKYLREIGITYNDKVISVEDGTPNLTLSLMGLRGFTEYHYRDNYNEVSKIKRMIELGASYIVVNKHNELGKVTKSFLGEKIGQYNDISIYTIN